jgi:hypothetical protein
LSDPRESFDELSYVFVFKIKWKPNILNWLMQGDLNP